LPRNQLRETPHGESDKPNQANKELDNLRTPAQIRDTRKKWWLGHRSSTQQPRVRPESLALKLRDEGHRHTQ
jgi:hypothetical protein